MKTQLWSRGLVALFVVTTFTSAINKIVAHDAWLHLSIGRLIWTLKGLPQSEPFTYPIFGESFSYNSWLFGLMTYSVYQNFGEAGLVLLKAGIVTAAFYFLFKDSLRPHKNFAITALVMTAALMLSQMRFVLRPDIVFMLFLSFSIFSLNAYMYDGKKYIYALPLTHMLWANMHASIIVMFVPFLAFIVGSIIQRRLNKYDIGDTTYLSKRQIKLVMLILAASFAASLLTPYLSLHQYIYGAKYESSAWHTQYIMENLYPERVLFGMLGITAVVLVSFLLNRKRFSAIYALLVAPFIFLSFGGHRFIFVIAIVGFPILIRNISESLERKGVVPGKAIRVIAVVCMVTFGAAAMRIATTSREFGFTFDHSRMPKGAVEYLDEKGIYGRVLNQYRFGQYITWNSYPMRPVFVDGRAHLPVKLLEDMLYFRTKKGVLDGLYEKYGFDYILTAPLIGQMDAFVPSSDPGWALVHWDDVSLVYLRRDAKYQNVISEDEYIIVRPEVSPIKLLEKSGDKELLEGLIQELERNMAETKSLKGHVLLGYAYLAAGSLDEASVNLHEVLRIKPKYSEALYGLGLMFERLGNMEAAKRHLKMARKHAPYPELAQLAEDRLKRLPRD